MQMARGAVVDLQSVTKKKVAHSRNWALLDSNGETQMLDADKYAIMHRVRIHARDLRILDPLLSYPSTILGRDQAIVLNLEHITAIITAEEVLLRNPSDGHVIPIMEELCRRLPKGSATQRTDLLGDGQEQLNESHDVDAGDEDESPFEFRALEVALEAICSFLDARTTELETDAYPALDELTSKELAFNHLLPERYIRSENERPSLSNTPPQIGIPSIDMKLLLGENDCRPKEMEKLAMACQEWGFFQVLNHGISGSLMERMKRVTREFILLPLQEKVEYAVQEHEGYGEAFVFSEDQPLDWSDLGLLKDEIFSADAIL